MGEPSRNILLNHSRDFLIHLAHNRIVNNRHWWERNVGRDCQFNAGVVIITVEYTNILGEKCLWHLSTYRHRIVTSPNSPGIMILLREHELIGIEISVLNLTWAYLRRHLEELAIVLHRGEEEGESISHPEEVPDEPLNIRDEVPPPHPYPGTSREN